jgi:hypothetical protein
MGKIVLQQYRPLSRHGGMSASLTAVWVKHFQAIPHWGVDVARGLALLFGIGTGGNATGFNFFVQEVDAKRVGILHELLLKAAHVALLLNPANATNTEREVQGAARALGLQIRVLTASTSAKSMRRPR